MYILASNNKGKVSEIKQILNIDLKTLDDLGIEDEIEEFGLTFEQNALIKAQAIGKLYPDAIIISDDSGLEVKALNNEPGVYSKRYSQSDENVDYNNNKLLLEKMKNVTDRSAMFRTVICIYSQNLQICHLFSGNVCGQIGERERGDDGFGYDPLFMYGDKSFAELTSEQKNQISHRKNALVKVIESGLLNG